MKTSKYLAIALLLGFSSTSSAGSCDEETGECTPPSPFDVTNAEFALDMSNYPKKWDEPWNCHTVEGCFSVDTYPVELSPQLKALMQGMAQYAEEYSAWADAGEWYLDYVYTESKNADLSDNIAYAIIEPKVRIKYSINGADLQSIRGGDIIHGSDWNNNGQIDTLENVEGVTYYTSVVSFDLPPGP
ncbi:MAG: hypothetical protein AAFX56_12770 [Pseudomonadota bacterium]